MLWMALLVVTTAQAPAAGAAQGPPTLTTTIGSVRAGLDLAKSWLVKAAEQVPEEHYAFKPAPTVRSMGEVFGHVADANFMICGMVSGKKPPMSGIEKSKKTKADLQAALAESFKFCEATFDGLTEATANEVMPKFFLPGTHSRLGVLAFNNAHDFEHYGNIVTYMRIKGLVPPSTADRQ